MKKGTKKINRDRRHGRIRAKVSGTSKRPRAVVFKSNRHVFVQLIDDGTKKTLVSGSSKISTKNAKGNKTDKASAVGETVGKKAIDKGIKTVVFDKGGYKYHGRVKAVAEGLRKAGLKF